jgi:DNA invertase Pin-like site-specific DNA recombinase
MKNRTTRFISYRRVSTEEQASSRLGLEAQETAIAKHVEAVGGKMIAGFVDVASGDDDGRPGFVAAVALAKRTGSSLIVSRLDRLSRAVAVIAGLMRDEVGFVACDRPDASEMELHLIAILAQEERRLIRVRTREALRRLIARGVLLGSRRPGHWDGRESRRRVGQKKATRRAAEKKREASSPAYEAVREVASVMPGASLREIASEANRRNIPTPQGSVWRASSVRRAILVA